MPVEVKLPTVLRQFTNGEGSVESEGETIGDVLAELSSKYPGMDEQLGAAEADIPRFVNIYLNDEDVRYLEKLNTKVSNGDIISILPAVAGGKSGRVGSAG